MTNREGSTNEMELQGRKTSGTALSLRNAMKKSDGGNAYPLLPAKAPHVRL